jgi:DNA replication protein DnaC
MVDYEEIIIRLSKSLNLDLFCQYKQYYDLSKSFEENIAKLLELQYNLTNERKINRKIKLSGITRITTLDQFKIIPDNWPYLDFEKVKRLANNEYINLKHNIIMIGQSGKGKTHLAVALGLEAIKHNFTVKFFKADQLVNKLRESKTNKSLERTMSEINRHELLIIDELGYLKSDDEFVTFIFNIISRRYEQKSTIITTNFALPDWKKFCNDQVLIGALVDRLAHYSEFLDMTGGKSFRVLESLNKPISQGEAEETIASSEPSVKKSPLAPKNPR